MYVDRAVSKPTLTCGQLEPSLTLPSAPHFYFTGPLPFMKYSLPCHPKSSRPKPSQLPLSPNLVSLCKSPFTLSITPGSASLFCVHVQWLQSCPTLCDHMHYSPPGSSVHGIFLARILEWVTMPSSRGSSQPRAQTRLSCIVSGCILYH